MSGIAAVWHLDGAPLERMTIDRIAGRLAPRPADAVGTWLDGPVGLVQWQLHTTPESFHETLPLRSEDGRAVLTAVARLDNRAELIDTLGLARRAAREPGDAALILRAWERWGEECPAHLLGDFAFAVWDARQHVLFCARDQAGVKPLYYYLGPRIFAIASDTRALLAIPDVPRRLDDVRIAAYLVPGLEDRVRTFYDDVLRLPAGNCLRVTSTGGAPRAYWQLDPTRELPARSDSEYAEAFRELFVDAVRCRLRSSAPVAAALSGGLDSSSVVCIAGAIQVATGAAPLATYTARFPTLPGCDEGPYVAAVVRQGQLSPRDLRGDLLDPLGEFEDALDLDDETFHSAGYYMHGALYRAARADGAKVFLEGMAGDAVLSHGTGYLHGLARGGRWLALGSEIRQLSRLNREPGLRTLRAVAAAVAPSPLIRAWRRLRHRGALGPSMIRAEFASRIHLDDRLRAAAPASSGVGLEAARRQHWRALTSPRLAAVQETLAAAAESTGVDVRDPFLDRRLMEFCLALPASQKIRRGRTRIVARHALASVLPPEILNRPGKARLDLMFSSALTVYGRARLDRLMREAGDVLGPYVPTDSIDRTYRAYIEQGAAADRNRVWRLATLALWLRRATR